MARLATSMRCSSMCFTYLHENPDSRHDRPGLLLYDWQRSSGKRWL
jgi:hypothetical protein